VASSAGIAWGAHVGGFSFGILVGLYWRARERTGRRAVPPVATPIPA